MLNRVTSNVVEALRDHDIVHPYDHKPIWWQPVLGVFVQQNQAEADKVPPLP